MKRKKKFPKMKRALPLALVVVMMMTMFVLGTSAQEIKGFEVCDHFMDLTVVMTNDEAWANLDDTYDESSNTHYVYLDCPVCKIRYQVFFENTVMDYQNGYVIFRPNFCGDNGYLYDFSDERNRLTDFLGLEYFDSLDENIDDGESFETCQVVKRIVMHHESSDGSMVGEMTDTITTSFGGLLKGVGASIVNFFDKTVIAENGGLTTLATWTLAFLGIGFGFMVVKFITNKVRKK